jgi:spermidine synthase
MPRWVFLLVFAASGAAALVYEVTWTRLLTLQLGHGVAAASTVLAAFMGGLAAGAALGGRIASRMSPAGALAAYAGLEIGIALLALLLPWQLHLLEPLLVRTYANGNGGLTFAGLRLASSLVLLALPALAMGATFPVASRWTVRHAARAAGDAGRLYAANTVGAALGAVFAGFVLLPRLGLSGTTWIGVLLNVAAAAGALAIRRDARTEHASLVAAPVVLQDPAHRSEQPRRPAAGARGGRNRPKADSIGTGRPWIAAAALGLSGFSSLALQVVWTRLLALVLGPTTYAFSIIVALFIAGIAVGSTIGSRLVAHARHPMAGLALCLVGSAGMALVAAAAVDWSLLAVARVVARPDATFGGVLLRQVLLVTVLLAPMTIAFGAAFPFAVAVAARSDDTVIGDLGLVYAVNTAGAILGALASGFALIPWLGLLGSIRLVATIAALGAAVMVVVPGTRARGRIAVFAASVGVLAAAVAMPPWNYLLLSSGAYKYAPSLRGPDLETALTAGELRYYREGAAGTVAVRDLTGTRSLAIDGKVDASNSGDMLTQRLLAHLPLLLHESPREVAILGLGSGVTLGSALRHPIARATVLEISPEVVHASEFFRHENHDALADPRTRLLVGDGRTHLLLSRDHYDVIISEPSNPWMAGIAALFTRDFFLAARDRLAPGGVLCQWAHTYDISGDDLRSIVATFLSVFPEGTLWLVGDGDVLLVGSNAPFDPKLSGIAAAWRRTGVAHDLEGVGARSPFALLSLFVGEGRAVADWAGPARVQTDDRAALEFSGPRSVFGRPTEDNAEALRALITPANRPPAVHAAIDAATAADWRDRGWMLLEADAFRPAFDDFRRALTGDPADPRALDGLLRASVLARREAETKTLLTSLANDPANLPAKLALSRLLAGEGALDDAARIPLGVLQTNPRSVPALEQLASVLSDAGDTERLAPVVARLRLEAPDGEATHYYAASLLFMQNRPDLAMAAARAVIAKNPSHARAQNLLGAALASLGDREGARSAFLASIEANPQDSATYANLGTLELEAGNPRQAAQHFAAALIVDPLSEAARRGLADASARLR